MDKLLKRDYGPKEMRFGCSECTWEYVAAYKSTILDHVEEHEAVNGFLKHDCRDFPEDKRILAKRTAADGPS